MKPRVDVTIQAQESQFKKKKKEALMPLSYVGMCMCDIDRYGRLFRPHIPRAGYLIYLSTAS